MRVRSLRPGGLTLRESLDGGCLSLFFAAAVLVVYRHFWADSHDPNKCDALLTHGRWLDHLEGPHLNGAGPNWQPAGCMMHEYTAKDISACLTSRKIVFVGDSTTRQVFWATAKKLEIIEHEAKKHASFSFSKHDVAVEFFWDPFLNSSSLQRELATASLSESEEIPTDTTALLVVGGGLWHAKYLGEASIQRFKDSIDRVVHLVKPRDAEIPQSFQKSSFHDIGNLESLVTLAPVQIPLYETLSLERAAITPAKLSAMNQYLGQLVDQPLPIAWAFSRMIWHEPSAYQPEGLHVTGNVAARMADILLNLRCNAQLRRRNTKGYPMDKTCCNAYTPPNWTQSMILNGSLGIVPCLILITIKESRKPRFLPSRDIARAIAILAMAICYCYYADRTQLFNKAQKHFTSTGFMALCTVTLLFGIFSIRRSTNSPMQRKLHSPERKISDQPFLSRDQTDEWKGWMQFVILIYHYTGASKILWIYEIIRVLVASYLFMTGFGHTVFFYRKGDYSLRRCASVLIRLNMLSCILPYAMKTDYLFYYFAPLISFWYVVIYTTMAIGCSKNKSLVFLISKMVVSAGFTTALIRIPGVFELAFYCLEKSCHIHWNVTEWRFRLQLDSYIVYVGMLCGIVFVRLTKVLGPARLDGNIWTEDRIRRHFHQLHYACLSLCFITTVLFFLFARQAPDKYAYNKWVPYISAFPIFSFIILRNISRHTRNFHSSIFAWMGRQSLETFTLQFHIWLAADTKGLLSLGVLERVTGNANLGRRVEFAVLTILFLWVCWHVAAATQTLTTWIVDPSEVREGAVIEEQMAYGEELPRTRSKERSNAGISMKCIVHGVGTGVMKSANGVKRVVAGDLRVRLAIIMAAMWLFNIVA